MEANQEKSDNREKSDQNDDKLYGREKLFSMTLETFLFNKQIQNHKENNNKINKQFAKTLENLIDNINDFLATADIQDQDDDDKARDIDCIIPTIEASILQVHRSYYCKICNQAVGKSSSKAIHQHFFGAKHLRNLRVYTEKVERNSSENIQNHKSTIANQAQSSDEGSTQSLDLDLVPNGVKNKKPEKQRLTSLPARVRDFKPNKKLPKKMREFLTKANLSEFILRLQNEGQRVAEQNKHIRVCEMLRRRLTNKYPSVKVYSFGSYSIGLGHEKADLDIFIDTENCFFGKLTKRKMKDAIFNVQRILASVPDNQWTDFMPVIKARTPILRTFCRIENVDCDLSFSNGLSTANTGLISYLINLQPICKRLALFVKFWSSELKFGLSSYCLTLMVIFYLQHEKILPSIHYLQELCKPVVIDGWNTGFATPNLAQLKIQMIRNYPYYLVGFFRFYGIQYDFTNYIICPLTGTRVPKHLFDHGKENTLQSVFKPYVAYMSTIDLEEADEVEDLFASYKPLVVQDPFELIHNVGKGFNEAHLIRMIHYMRCTHDILHERFTQ